MNLRPLLRILFNPGVYFAAIVTALLVLLAYQVRPQYDIQFGTATDGPLLNGFNAGEDVPDNSGVTFRWSTGDAYVTLQDIGRQDLDVTLTVNGSRPPGQPPASIRVVAGESEVLRADPPPGFQDYSFTVPARRVDDGTLTLHIMSNTFSPQGDSRELGVIVTRLRVTPSSAGEGFIRPPIRPWLSLTMTAGLMALILAALGWGAGGAALGGLAVGLPGAALLVGDRLWLTTDRWYLNWPVALLAGAVVIGLVYWLGGWLLKKVGRRWSDYQRRLLLALMLMVFAVRLAGQLHPQIFIVDLLFHAHRFDTVESGQLLFTINSAEWGGHSTFYLPTPYVMMLPLEWILHNELLVIKLFSVTLGTLGAFVIFYISQVTLNAGRAGLIAASLYLTLPISVLPYSWGITSNVFGEFFALCALGIAITGYRQLSPTRPAFWALLATLLFALLSHPGVVQLTVTAFLFISLWWLLGRRILAPGRGALWTLACLILAVGISYLVYYSHFAADMIATLQQIQVERAAQAKPGTLHIKIGGSVADKSLGLVVRYVDSRREWLLGGLKGFWQEAKAYYRVWPVLGAILGYLSLWVHAKDSKLKRQQVVLVLAAAGWLLAVVLFAVIGWTVNLYVRYALFALPVVALGAGLLLSQLWQRGRVGALLSVMLLTFFAAEALALWQYRITYAFK